MPKTSRDLYTSLVTTDYASVGTSFDKTKAHAHALTEGPILSNGKFFGYVEGLYVRVTSISGATKLTVAIACDADGDYKFFPDTEATIATGITTNTTGTVAYEFKMPLKQFFDSATLYVFVKTDSGTVTLDASCLAYSS